MQVLWRRPPRLQRGWDVSCEQTGGRVWSMAGFLSSNCSSGGTLGLISEVLKVGFYGVRPRASCVSRVIFKTRRDYGCGVRLDSGEER